MTYRYYIQLFVDRSSITTLPFAARFMVLGLIEADETERCSVISKTLPSFTFTDPYTPVVYNDHLIMLLMRYAGYFTCLNYLVFFRLVLA